MGICNFRTNSPHRDGTEATIRNFIALQQLELVWQYLFQNKTKDKNWKITLHYPWYLYFILLSAASTKINSSTLSKNNFLLTLLTTVDLKNFQKMKHNHLKFTLTKTVFIKKISTLMKSVLKTTNTWDRVRDQSLHVLNI